MPLIYETPNFTVIAPEKPHIDRADGGHIIINPKVTVEDRTKLSADLAKELMKLSMVVGEAMHTVLNQRGVDIGRLNYQDNGNWRPELHLHLYGRAKSAKIQPYGQALHFPKPEKGHYEGLEPLNAGDIDAIRAEIERLLGTEKYQWF
jgi:diadenosine tetraphosphate (Ap4A) HIT family hydrolase